QRAGISLNTGALPSLAHFHFQHDGELTLTTLFTQLMLEKGYLAFNQFKPSYAHQRQHVENYMASVNVTFEILGTAIAQGSAARSLAGPPARRGFYRLT